MVVLPFTPPLGANQSSATKVSEVARDTRLIGFQCAMQIADTNLAVPHEVEQPKAIQIRQRSKNQSDAFHAIHIRLDEFVFK
jgi:hypothetical protein